MFSGPKGRVARLFFMKKRHILFLKRGTILGLLFMKDRVSYHDSNLGPGSYQSFYQTVSTYNLVGNLF